MHVVKSVGVLSFARIMGLIYGCMGLIVVPIFLIAALAGVFTGNARVAFPLVFAIFAPLIYGAIGFVFGAIGALIYNLVAAWVGGFELELVAQPSGLVAPYALVPPPRPNI
jgi:hypothetical protein